MASRDRRGQKDQPVLRVHRVFKGFQATMALRGRKDPKVHKGFRAFKGQKVMLALKGRRVTSPGPGLWGRCSCR